MNSISGALLALSIPLLSSSSPPLHADANEPTLRMRVTLSSDDLLPDPQAGVRLDPGNAGGLKQPLQELAASAGVNLWIGAEAEGVLQQGLSQLTAPVDVPASEAWSFVGSLLLENGLVLSMHRADEPRLLSVHSVVSGHPSLKFWRVDEAQLDSVVQHPALLISTTVSLPNLEVRNLVNSLRGLLTNITSGNMLPLGDSKSLLIQGHAGRVRNLVDMLQRMDAAEGERIKVLMEERARSAQDQREPPVAQPSEGAAGSTDSDE